MGGLTALEHSCLQGLLVEGYEFEGPTPRHLLLLLPYSFQPQEVAGTGDGVAQGLLSWGPSGLGTGFPFVRSGTHTRCANQEQTYIA